VLEQAVHDDIDALKYTDAQQWMNVELMRRNTHYDQTTVSTRINSKLGFKFCLIWQEIHMFLV
jgi:hypothetical protein